MHTHTCSPQFGQRSSPHLLCYMYNRQVRAGLCTHTHTRSPLFGQRSSPHLLCYIYNRQVRAGLCTHTETCTLINASTYAHKTNTHVRCMHAYINTNTHRGIHEYTRTHIHVFTCMHARMYTNACILMHAKCQHVHMHTHAHTHTHCLHNLVFYAQSTRMHVSGSLHKHT